MYRSLLINFLSLLLLLSASAARRSSKVMMSFTDSEEAGIVKDCIMVRKNICPWKRKA